MYFAYIDESGDVGPKGSATYSLSCLLVEAARWPEVFDETIIFRRSLFKSFGLPVRAEIKANHLIRGSGAFRPLKLGESARFSIWRACLRFQVKLQSRAFAVVVDKAAVFAKGHKPQEVAWTYLIQRLERFTTKTPTTVLVVHDEGDELFVRSAVRKARRAGVAGMKFGTGILKRPARLILDDPVSRSSAQSYFIQFADLCAYAAYRRLYPPPPRPIQICPQGMWDELGAARHAPANTLSGGPPGIVRVA